MDKTFYILQVMGDKFGSEWTKAQLLFQICTFLSFAMQFWLRNVHKYAYNGEKYAQRCLY